jgi:hypothetical protein
VQAVGAKTVLTASVVGALAAASALAMGTAATVGACGGSPTSTGFSDPEADSSTGSSGSSSGAQGDDGDAAVFTTPDTGTFHGNGDGASDPNGECALGSAGSFATSDNLNLFGDIVYYEDGGALPAGRYRIKYVDGCMKYDYFFNWQVQSTAPDSGSGNGFWFVGNTSDDRIVMPPGSTSAFATFDECVTANLAVPAQEFAFDGGKIGVWLDDTPYADNTAGDDGRNPKWQLTLLGTCPPNLAPK